MASKRASDSKEWADDEEQVRRVFDSYFKRLWGNTEAYIHLEGFEEAWEKRYGKSKIENLTNEDLDYLDKLLQKRVA